MSKPAARIGDMHVCPMVTPGTPPIPHVGGPVTGPGAPTVLIGGMPAAVMGDMCTCVGPPDTIVLGSVGVLIGGKPAARMGDMCAHGGTIVAGCPTVLIGEVSPGAPVPPVVLAPIMQDFEKQLTQAADGDPALAEKAVDAAHTALALQQAAENGDAVAVVGKVPAGEEPPSDKVKGWLKVVEEASKIPVDYLPGPLEKFVTLGIQAISWFRALPGGDARTKLQVLWLWSSKSFKELFKSGK